LEKARESDKSQRLVQKPKKAYEIKQDKKNLKDQVPQKNENIFREDQNGNSFLHICFIPSLNFH